MFQRVSTPVELIHIDYTPESLNMPETITLGKPFMLERGGRKAKYKIIKPSFLDDAYSLVSDHAYIHQNNAMEAVYKQAIDYT